MKANQIYRSLFSLLLVLAILASCIGSAFAAQTEETKTKGITFKSGTGELIVADWVHDYTISDRGAENLMADYAKAGITDVYLLVKGTAGKIGWTSGVSGTVQASNGDILQSACTAAKKYGIRVHAWIMAGHDDNYLNRIDSSAMAYHFRAGYSSDVNQRMNLRDKGYREYTAKLVKELVSKYDIAGIHLDCIRYFELYYDWGQNARDELLTNYGITIEQYNAATKAMCKRGGYSYTMKTGSTPGYNNGASYSYVAYAASGTSASGSTTFSTVLGSSSYGDAYKGAQAFMALRTDTVAGFVQSVKEAAGEDIIISCAIMPEPIEETFSKCLYGQDVAKLGKVCDYITPMAYATQYQQTSSWPAALSEKCAAAGANVVTGVQAFNETYVSYASDLNAEIPIILSKAETINANSSYGDILGYAFFRGATMTIGNAKYNESDSTVSLYLGNQTTSADTKLVLKMQNGMTVDTSKLTNGLGNKSGFASGASFSVSSDKKTITITNGGSSVLSALSSAGLTIAVKGTPSTTHGSVQLTSYKGSSYSEGKSFCVAAAVSAGVYNGITKGTCNGAHTDVETWTDSKGKHFAFCYNCLTNLTEGCVLESSETDGYVSYNCVGGHNSTTGLTDVDAHSADGGCGYGYIASSSLNLHFNLGDLAGETADWNGKKPNSMTGSVDNTKGILYGEITGKDPYIATDLSTDEMHYNISAGDVIELRMKTSVTTGSAKGVQVFFTTEAQTVYNEGYSVRMATLEHANGEYQVIQMPFEKGKTYIGQTLAGLRVDPLNVDGPESFAANYEIDYIYIGPEGGAPSAQYDKEIFFDFTNDTSALLRYNGIVYGGRNFDQSGEGYWAVSGTGSAKNYSIDNEAGTLNVVVGDTPDSNGVYGIYVETTAKYNCYPWSGENHWQYYPLSFNAEETDDIQIRFKLNGCDAIEGENAIVYVTYDYLKDGTYYSASDMHANFDVTAEGYQTLTFPASENFKTADMIKTLGFRFKNIKSSGDGTVIIDYIYAGEKDELYFDFSNTEEDQLRYGGKTYGDNNFDTGNWFGRTTSVAEVSYDKEKGTVSFSSKDASQNYHYIQTSNTGHTTDMPLNYVPGVGDSMQIRFKIENAQANGKAELRVHYMAGDQAKMSDKFMASLILDENCLDGEYHLVNLPLGKDFGEADFISSLRIGFAGISSMENAPAKFTIDYIYVGRDEDKPAQDKLFFDFVGDEEAYSRYSTVTYGYTRFDTAENWGKSNLSDITVSEGVLTGNVSGNTFLRTSLKGSMQADKCPLSYLPGENDYLQVRFKLEDSSASKMGIKLYYFAQDGEDWQSVPSAVYDITGDYVLATVPLAGTDFTSAQVVKGIQVAFNGASDGKLTVDYIYIGSKNDLPVDADLFFDFSNTSEDQLRYASKTYGQTNFDNAKTLQWNTLTTSQTAGKTVIDNKKGTLTASPLQQDFTSICVDTVKTLCYHPKDADVFQIRLKMSGFAAVNGKNAFVNLQFCSEKGVTMASTESVKLSAQQLDSEDYMLLSIPLNEEISALGTVSKLRIYFGNVSGGTGSTITVDSIFVGKTDSAPIHDYLFFDFTDTENDQDRYSSKTYGNVNFDIGNWKYNSSRNEAPVFDKLEGTMTTAVVGSAPYLQTVGKSTAVSSSPLTFIPSESTEIIQLRLKLKGLEPVVEGATGQIVVHLMTEEGGEVQTDLSLRYGLKEANLKGEYFTVNLNAKDYLQQLKNIYALRVTGSNLRAIEGTTGEMTIDYIYVGSRIGAPSGEAYFVDFMGNDGQSVVQHSLVLAGCSTEYTEGTPEKESDESYHYRFIGWKDEQGNAVDLSRLQVTQDLKLYPDYSAEEHKLRYTMHIDEAGITVELHYCASCEFNRACGHIWDEGSITVQPTCTEDGILIYGCTMCAATKAEPIAATGHKETVDAAVAANCTTSGLTVGYHCTNCGEILLAQEEIPAIGHSLEYHEKKPASCEENGNVAYYSCVNCGKYFMDGNAGVELPESYISSPATGHNFANGTCTTCGKSENREAVVDAAISIGEQLYLESDLTMNFRIRESFLTKYDISTAYLVVERDIYGTDGTKTVDSQILSSHALTDGRLVFVYRGIAASQMNDEIRVTLYIEDRTGKLYRSQEKITSITAYAKALLEAMPTGYPKLYTVVMDMLNYGSAAQTYFKRHADAPANQAYEIFADYADYATKELKTPLVDLSGQSANAGATGQMNLTLDLGTSIGIIYKVTLPDGVDPASAKLVVKDAAGKALKTIDLSAASVDNRGRYVVIFDGLASRQMREVTYATVYANGAAITATYSYSISTYAAVLANTPGYPASLINLANLMVAYGDAAKAYFG